MKKFLIAGVLALTLTAVSQQQAPAWVNFKFGVGLNWQWQSGGNNFLWGAWRGAQPPGFDHGYYGMPMDHGYGMPVGGDSAPTPTYTAPPPTPVPTINQAYYGYPTFNGAYYVPVHLYR